MQLRALSVKCSHWVSSQVLANSLETNASSGSGHCSKADIGPGIESLLIRVCCDRTNICLKRIFDLWSRHHYLFSLSLGIDTELSDAITAAAWARSDTQQRLTESPGPGGIDDPIFDNRKSIHRCSFNLQFSFYLWTLLTSLEMKSNWLSSMQPRRYKWFLTPGSITGGRKVHDPKERCLLNSNKPNGAKRTISLMNK